MTEELQTDEVRQIYDPIGPTPTSYVREPEGAHPPLDFPPYKSTTLRHPKQPLVYLPQTVTEVTGPQLGPVLMGENDNDLTVQHESEPIGERIVVSGRVFDTEGKPLRGTLVEIWQANAAGRYIDPADNWPAPLDPNFIGAGRCLSDGDGGYRFVTVRPGAYPWRNHHNAWRPAHIHFSVFGSEVGSRLVTQMYFPDDPLLDLDPILQSVPDPKGRQRLVSSFDLETTEPEWALGFRWDIVLRGRAATPRDDRD